MFFAYRSIFTLQRELFYRQALRAQKNNPLSDDNEDIVESYRFEDIEQEDVEESDEEDSEDDKKVSKSAYIRKREKKYNDKLHKNKKK